MDERKAKEKHGGRIPLGWAFGAATMILVGAGLRILAARGDLWLDEIWSYNLAQKASSLLGVFTEIHHNNNHYLNTAFMYLVGRVSWLYIYRIPSILFGAATVFLAWRIGRKRSVPEGLTAAVLAASSYLLIQYSSEARGYGEALFFSLLAFHEMERFLESESRSAAAGFSVSAALGFLSHLTFVYSFAAMAAWSAWDLVVKRRRWFDAFPKLALCHVLPIATVTFLYVVDIRNFQGGGGDPRSWSEGYLRASALGWGIEAEGGAAMAWGWGAVALTLLGLLSLWQEKCERWVPFAVGIFLAPAMAQWIMHYDTAYERFFLVCIGYELLVLASMMSRLWRMASWGRIAYFSILAVFLILNGRLIERLLRDGRGSYQATLRFMAEQSRNPEVTITSDQDFRNRTVIEFYAPFVPRKLIYYDSSDWPRSGTEWYLMHRQELDFIAPKNAVDPFGHRFSLVKEVPYAGLSGWAWYVYHRNK